jgi:hypothetical protein
MTAASHFSKYCDKQSASISDLSFEARRATVLAPVQRMPTFIQLAQEAIGVSHATVVTINYAKMCMCMIGIILKTANSNSKYQSIVLVENMHFLWRYLHGQGVPILDDFAGQALAQYSEHLRKYVRWIVESEMGDVTSYFTELSSMLGTMDKDVIFQNKFSKASFKKLCENQLQGGHLERHLEAMEKRVAKHLGREAGLRSTVWGEVSSYLISCYEQWEMIVVNIYRPLTLRPSSEDVRLYCVSLNLESN